jgi:hypothetical protein
MKRIPLSLLALIICCNLASAQKGKFFGADTWTGEVVSADEGTREITLRFEDQSKTETFTGVLVDDYKVTLKDGTSRALKVSEIPAGMRIRVIYKTKGQDVGGRRVKFNQIVSIEFVGRDQYTRLRSALNLDPQFPVSESESKAVPASSPLKLYVSIVDPQIKEGFLAWAGKWNKDKGAKYGALEIVPDLSQADVSLVIYYGSNLIVMEDQSEFLREQGKPYKPHTATVFLLARKGNGLDVLWREAIEIDSSDSLRESKMLIEDEVAKRIKAAKK